MEIFPCDRLFSNMIKCVLQKNCFFVRCVMRTIPCVLYICSDDCTIFQGGKQGMEGSSISQGTCDGPHCVLRKKHVCFLKPDARVRAGEADAAVTQGTVMCKPWLFLLGITLALV